VQRAWILKIVPSYSIQCRCHYYASIRTVVTERQHCAGATVPRTKQKRDEEKLRASMELSCLELLLVTASTLQCRERILCRVLKSGCSPAIPRCALAEADA
jgi:hypothetical protein